MKVDLVYITIEYINYGVNGIGATIPVKMSRTIPILTWPERANQIVKNGFMLDGSTIVAPGSIIQIRLTDKLGYTVDVNGVRI